MVSKEQRRRQLAREKHQRQQQRRVDQHRRTRRRTVWIAGVVVVALAAAGAAWASVGLTGDDAAPPAPDTTASAPATASAAPSAPVSAGPNPCAAPAAGAVGTAQWKSAPRTTIDTGRAYALKLSTTCGPISLSLDARKAPHTVNSIAFLAGHGYFDHTKCHRLTTAHIYVLQCGDPTGSGNGGPGYTIPDENLKALGKPKADGSVVYPAGTVAMANTGHPDSGGSQFFLVYKASPLAPKYTPFGTIDAGGMKVLRKIAEAGVAGGGSDGAPNAHVVINKAVMSASS